jgi:transposase InsO family protein
VQRFCEVGQLPNPVEWLSDNGSRYIARGTQAFAPDSAFMLRRTPHRSAQSNGMAEAFVKILQAGLRLGERDAQCDCAARALVSTTARLYSLIGTCRVNVIDPHLYLRHVLKCIAGENTCPPEDVGGPHAYIDFLAALKDPAHEEHTNMLEWIGGSFDPLAFDLADVNERLAPITA